MNVVEQSRIHENSKERPVNLSSFTHVLSHKILSFESAAIERKLPEKLVAAFQDFSLKDRGAYWEEQPTPKNFGEQMVEWLGSREKPGIVQWVQNQTDTDVVTILKELGLKGLHDTLPIGVSMEKFGHIVETIYEDLVKVHKEHLFDNLSTESQKNSLIFYATFLSPGKDNLHKDATSLIDTIVKTASELHKGNSEETLKILQKLSPLFRVAGVDAQHILGALTVAKYDGLNNESDLKSVSPTATLSEAENDVWRFLNLDSEDTIVENNSETSRDALLGDSAGEAPSQPAEQPLAPQETSSFPEVRIVDEMRLRDFLAEFAQFEKRNPGKIPKRRREFEMKDKDIKSLGLFEDVSGGKFAETASQFQAEFSQEGSFGEYLLKEFKDKGFGENTLLAYALEATSIPELQQYLIGVLLTQITAIYGENHPAQERLEELGKKLATEQPLEKQDFIDMGLLVMPFDLQKLTQALKQNAPEVQAQ